MKKPSLCKCGCGRTVKPYDRTRQGRKKGDFPPYYSWECYKTAGRRKPLCPRGHAKNEKGRCPRCSITRIRMKRYNMTLEQAEAIPERCECCGILLERPYADHNHKTGEFRGWLCQPCNSGLGFFRDDISLLKKAIRYLRNAA